MRLAFDSYKYILDSLESDDCFGKVAEGAAHLSTKTMIGDGSDESSINSRYVHSRLTVRG